MIEVSKEEFVKRHLRLFDDSLGEEIRLWQIESAEDDYYHLTGNELNLVLVDREGWLKIKEILAKVDMENGVWDAVKLHRTIGDLKELIKDD